MLKISLQTNETLTTKISVPSLSKLHSFTSVTKACQEATELGIEGTFFTQMNYGR